MRQVTVTGGPHDGQVVAVRDDAPYLRFPMFIDPREMMTSYVEREPDWEGSPVSAAAFPVVRVPILMTSWGKWVAPWPLREEEK